MLAGRASLMTGAQKKKNWQSPQALKITGIISLSLQADYTE